MLSNLMKSKKNWAILLVVLIAGWYILPLVAKIINFIIVVVVIAVIIFSVYVRNGIKTKLKTK
jgi:Flp pilus assembly protein TadB